MIMSQHHNVPSGATLTGALIGTVRHISSRPGALLESRDGYRE